MELDAWYREHLVCPVDHTPLEAVGGELVSPHGRTYPVVDGVPVMLVEEAEALWVAAASSRRARDPSTADPRAPELYVETLGIAERDALVEHARQARDGIDPVVAFLVAATCGNAYRHLIGRLVEYPIPELRLPAADGRTLLDIGCSWGRWSIAAARKGYRAVGIDPPLGAIMAARRVARQMGIDNRYLVADARFLPFRRASFDVAFSYSVLQHLPRSGVAMVVDEIARILKPGGVSRIQMANRVGIRNLYLQARRGRRARDFEVRYWTLDELREVFGRIGATEVSVDCFFGLGLQETDIDLMRGPVRLATRVSGRLRRWSERLPVLRRAADSVYVTSRAEP